MMRKDHCLSSYVRSKETLLPTFGADIVFSTSFRQREVGDIIDDKCVR